MIAKKRKPFLRSIPAWGLSLMVAFLSLILVFIFAGIFDLLGTSKFIDDSIAAYFLYGIVVALACFLICRIYPKTFWYVPFICNAVSIIAAIVEPNFWITSMWIAYGSGWILSTVGTIAGVLLGKRGITSR